MAELPLHLKKLETLPSALDIIRFLYEQDEYTADSYTIQEGLDISDRRFGKAIRRLATTGYVQMIADLEYRLTDQGEDAANELAAYDSRTTQETHAVPAGKIQRRMMIALPPKLVPGQPTPMYVGFYPDDQNQLSQSAQIVLRLSAMNAILSDNGDEMLDVSNGAAQHALHIIAKNSERIRVRAQVFQLAPNGEDISNCGGMYVDIDVTTTPENGDLIAYGVDVFLDPTS